MLYIHIYIYILVCIVCMCICVFFVCIFLDSFHRKFIVNKWPPRKGYLAAGCKNHKEM